MMDFTFISLRLSKKRYKKKIHQNQAPLVGSKFIKTQPTNRKKKPEHNFIDDRSAQNLSKMPIKLITKPQAIYQKTVNNFLSTIKCA